MSSGQRFVTPFAQFEDANTGVPLLGCQLFFYVSGTSTPANTYADVGLTIPNSNPVVATTGGRFSNIFLDPNVTYKVVLADDDDVQVWAADPVTAAGGSGSGFTAYTNIAALRTANSPTPSPLAYVEAYSSNVPTGGGWFAYVASDTSSADNGGTIIVDAFGNRYYRLLSGACSIDNFGAVQDSGITDNASAINAALAACLDVFVPASSAGAWYGFGSPLVIQSLSRLAGIGRASVLKANGSFGTGSPLLQNASPAPANLAARTTGIAIENLTIDANSQGSASVSLVATTGFRMRNVSLLNAPSDALLIAAKTTDPTIYCQNGWIRDLYAFTAQGAGIHISSGVEIVVDAPILDTVAQGNTAVAAIQLQGAASTALGRNLMLINPVVRNSGGGASSCGILIDGNGSSTWSDMEVIGGAVDSQTGIGLGYRDLNGLQVDGLTVNITTAAGISRTGAGTVGVANLSFDGVTVKNAGTDGFYLFNDNTPALTGCIVKGAGRDGVRLDGTTTRAQIVGGAFTSNGGFGVNEVNGSVNNTYLWGSSRVSNTSGAQSMSGALSVCDAVFISSTITPTANTGSNALAHGLGMKPKSAQVYLHCTTAELGHSVGDVIQLTADAGYGGGNAQSFGAGAWVTDATNCGYAFGRDGVNVMVAASPYLVSAITPANWAATVVAKCYF